MVGFTPYQFVQLFLGIIGHPYSILYHGFLPLDRISQCLWFMKSSEGAPPWPLLRTVQVPGRTKTLLLKHLKLPTCRGLEPYWFPCIVRETGTLPNPKLRFDCVNEYCLSTVFSTSPSGQDFCLLLQELKSSPRGWLASQAQLSRLFTCSRTLP